jgi:hypothetical protein
MKATPETATGLRADIVIECETEQELLSHLTVIRQQVKKKLREINNEITDTIILEDSNCYGDHTVVINLDKQ